MANESQWRALEATVQRISAERDSLQLAVEQHLNRPQPAPTRATVFPDFDPAGHVLADDAVIVLSDTLTLTVAQIRARLEPTPEAVERVGRAIRNAMPQGQVVRAMLSERPWETLDYEEQGPYRRMARAALAAMREG